jgi:hypothetical protein
MQTRTLADIVGRIQALAGKDNFDTQETARVLSLINARWFRAYTASEYWPRYITVGEPRYISPVTKAIGFSQDSAVFVSGAGTEDVNGVYQPTGTQNGRTLYSLGGNLESVTIYWTGSVWRISSDVTGTLVYYVSDNVLSPWLGTWTAVSGASPVAVVAESARADIDSFMRITTGSPQEASSSYTAREIDFFVSNHGAHPTSAGSESFTQLFVTYKKEWGGPYAEDSVAVPIEFFEYIAHGAFSDWLRSSGQSIPQAQAEDAVAQEMLNYELVKSQSRANAQISGPRFSTYISNQSRNNFSY